MQAHRALPEESRVVLVACLDLPKRPRKTEHGRGTGEGMNIGTGARTVAHRRRRQRRLRRGPAAGTEPATLARLRR